MTLDSRQPALLEKIDGPLLAALTSIPAGIWVADRTGFVIWMNATAAALVGERRGTHFTRFVASEDAADAREMLARAVHGRLEATSMPLRLRAVQGAVAADVAFVGIRDADEVIAVIALIRNELTLDDMPPAAPEPRLTPRQHQVLRLLAQGYSTTEMAGELQISEQTVRNHVRFLLAELRVRSRLEAVVMANRNNWV
jgi:DNA-binding NarL/FixJ family response regulator